MRTTAITLTLLLAFIAAVGCTDTKSYVVLGFAPTAGPDGLIAVTCWLPDTDLTRERKWDPVAQVAPVIGEEWLCN
jgi:hypothetical protein